jgi:hypothetical protein
MSGPAVGSFTERVLSDWSVLDRKRRPNWFVIIALGRRATRACGRPAPSGLGYNTSPNNNDDCYYSRAYYFDDNTLRSIGILNNIKGEDVFNKANKASRGDTTAGRGRVNEFLYTY